MEDKKKKNKKGLDDRKVLFVSRKVVGDSITIEGIELCICKNLGKADDLIEAAGETAYAGLVYCFDDKKKLVKGEEGAKNARAATRIKAALLRQEAKLIAFMAKFLRLRKDAFICVLFANPKNITATRRNTLLQGGAHMLTADPTLLSTALTKAVAVGGGRYTCPYCDKAHLTEDQLWEHCPMFHCKEPNQNGTHCPICYLPSRGPFQVHLRNEHGPVGRGEVHKEEKSGIDLSAFALVVCQRESDGKFLLVQEPAAWGWWLPGGRIDKTETFEQAAIRETKEEAGVDVELVGVIRVEFSPMGKWARMRTIFYARPVSEEQLPKSMPDYESCGAAWVTVEELEELPLRGREPLEWFNYIHRGGAVAPMSFLTLEGARPPNV